MSEFRAMEATEESKSEATVKLMVKDEIRHTVAEGNGPFRL